jgi:Family of unknown function (DUF6122)
MHINIQNIIQTTIHYGFHFIIPIFIAILFYKTEWKKVYFIFLATMLVDLDHLLANPIFDPNRCSIGFHFLHSYYAIVFYVFLLLHKNRYVKVVAIGLLMHMATDYQDCLWNR